MKNPFDTQTALNTLEALKTNESFTKLLELDGIKNLIDALGNPTELGNAILELRNNENLPSLWKDTLDQQGIPNIHRPIRTDMANPNSSLVFGYEFRGDNEDQPLGEEIWQRDADKYRLFCDIHFRNKTGDSRFNTDRYAQFVGLNITSLEGNILISLHNEESEEPYLVVNYGAEQESYFKIDMQTGETQEDLL